VKSVPIFLKEARNKSNALGVGGGWQAWCGDWSGEQELQFKRFHHRVWGSVRRPPPAAAGAAGGRAPFGASRPEPGCARPERPWLAAAIPAAEPGKNCNMVLGPKFVLS
jgi:hypothetical protein